MKIFSKRFFKEHILAFFASIFVGLVIVGPNLVLIERLGNNYHGIYLQSEAELHYLATMKEFAEGKGLGNPYIYEFKANVPSATFTFGEWLLALPTMLLTVSVSEINLLYKFLLPSITAFLAYFLFFRLTMDKRWSIAGMLAILLGNVLLSLPDIKHIFYLETVYQDMAIYARPINPQFSSILFFSYLHILFSAIERRSFGWFAALALLFGASFYVYFFSCTFLLALNAVFLAGFLLLKDWDIVKKMSCAIGSGLVLALPVFLHYFTLAHHPYYQLWRENSQIVFSRTPVISVAGIATALLFLVFLYQRKITSRIYFLGGLLLTTFVVLNQQILTGILVQEGHYHWYYNTPIYFLALFVIGKEFSSGLNRKIVTAALVFVSAVASFVGIFIQYSSYRYQAPQRTAEQRYAAVFDWLNTNTKKDSVVLANEKLSTLIPVYTSNNVVWAPYAPYHLVSPERTTFTTDFLLSSKDFSKDIARYRVDYVVWDKQNNPEWDMSARPSLELLRNENNLFIYKINK